LNAAFGLGDAQELVARKMGIESSPALLEERQTMPSPSTSSSAAASTILAATMILDDAKPLFLEFQAAGVQFAQPLRSEPWGARTFIVEDLDGNLLCFAGRGD